MSIACHRLLSDKYSRKTTRRADRVGDGMAITQSSCGFSSSSTLFHPRIVVERRRALIVNVDRQRAAR